METITISSIQTTPSTDQRKSWKILSNVQVKYLMPWEVLGTVTPSAPVLIWPGLTPLIVYLYSLIFSFCLPVICQPRAIPFLFLCCASWLEHLLTEREKGSGKRVNRLLQEMYCVESRSSVCTHIPDSYITIIYDWTLWFACNYQLITPHDCGDDLLCVMHELVISRLYVSCMLVILPLHLVLLCILTSSY